MRRQFVKRRIKDKLRFQRCRFGGKFNQWNCGSFSISHTFLEFLFHTYFSENPREFVFCPPLIAVTACIVVVTKETSSISFKFDLHTDLHKTQSTTDPLATGKHPPLHPVVLLVLCCYCWVVSVVNVELLVLLLLSC